MRSCRHDLYQQWLRSPVQGWTPARAFAQSCCSAALRLASQKSSSSKTCCAYAELWSSGPLFLSLMLMRLVAPVPQSQVAVWNVYCRTDPSVVHISEEMSQTAIWKALAVNTETVWVQGGERYRTAGDCGRAPLQAMSCAYGLPVLWLATPSKRPIPGAGSEDRGVQTSSSLPGQSHEWGWSSSSQQVLYWCCSPSFSVFPSTVFT